MVLLLLAFMAGALTALAPCVLPLLPLIIGGALTGSEREKYRPYVIAGSLAFSLILFTYLLKVSSLFIGVGPNLWVYISATIVVSLGIVSLFPEIYERITSRFSVQEKSDGLLKRGATRSGYVGAILTGFALGPVFSSCSPTYAFVLATVLPRNAITGFIYLISYSLGLVLVLLAVSIPGRKYMVRFSWAIDTHSLFRRGLGALFIIVGIGIGFGYDKKVELWATNHLPNTVTQLDQGFLATVNPPAPSTMGAKQFNVTPYKAPELVGINNWINSNPLTIASLRGKVVMVDFWTYSCINCVRTLPYVEKWYETYKSKGFVVIGVSAPEFGFEKVPANVARAAKADGLTYPIALDNNLSTWNSYANQYWPAHYLINKSGQIVSVHFGEGDYAATESAIQSLLGESGPLVSPQEAKSYNPLQTNETYFGTDRQSGFVGKGYGPGITTFTDKPFTQSDSWDLGGTWKIGNQSITAVTNSLLRFNVSAANVYAVVNTADLAVHRIDVEIDGKPAAPISVSGSGLYTAASFPAFSHHTVVLRVPADVSLNTFTFGG
jgi:cytochrome c biogenesis protein CcdA/thiol-disulfide isomerase/thioredoxin